MIDDQFNTRVLNIKCIGNVIFRAMLVHKVEEEGITVAEYMYMGHSHVNYEKIPSVVYMHLELHGSVR